MIVFAPCMPHKAIHLAFYWSPPRGFYKTTMRTRKPVSYGNYAFICALALLASSVFLWSVLFFLLSIYNTYVSYCIDIKYIKSITASGREINNYNYYIFEHPFGHSIVFLIVWFLPLLFIGICSGFGSRRAWRTVRDVQPFQHVDISDFSYPESLVRGSQQPKEEQQYHLLRPASQEAFTPPEQMLRSSTEVSE